METQSSDVCSFELREKFIEKQDQATEHSFDEFIGLIYDSGLENCENTKALVQETNEELKEFDVQIEEIEEFRKQMNELALTRFNLAAATFDQSPRAKELIPAQYASADAWLASTKGDLRVDDFAAAAAKIEAMQGKTFSNWQKYVTWVKAGAISKRIPIFSGARRSLIKQVINTLSEVHVISAGTIAEIEREKQRHINSKISDWVDMIEPVMPELLNKQQNANGVRKNTLDVFLPSWISHLTPSESRARPIISVGYLSNYALQGSHKLKAFSRYRNWEVKAETYTDSYIESVLTLNLDECGGFVCDNKQVVKNALLELVSLIPGGQVKVDAFDPNQLGESLSFMFGLGEDGEEIYGDMVRTSIDDLTVLLQQTEQHIAYVTQKYLQGQHKTITEYNIAAGEVAEPYRVLVLYDFPSGFSRWSGNFDEELIERLERIATVGRRAGIFTFVVTDAGNRDCLHALPWLPQYGEPVTHCGEMDGIPSGFTEIPGQGDIELSWRFVPFESPDETALEELLAGVRKSIKNKAVTQVTPARVTELANWLIADDYSHGFTGRVLRADPENESTWWCADAKEAATSVFGRMGADNVAELRFDSKDSSSAIIGGRTGMGKSVLIHSILASLITQYGPDELELFLIDLKEGVEFAPYAKYKLPHASVVAIESNREFAVSVLESLDAEIFRRGELFKAKGSNVDLGSYRDATGETLSRIVLVIDEFQVLFENETDAISAKAMSLLERVIRQGRAFGIHTLLASQSLTGSASAIKPLIGQISNRVVLGSSASDSQMLLSDENTDAELLSRPGEGILNVKSGIREANTRFQATFWKSEDRIAMVKAMREKADLQGFDRAPMVFEGKSGVELTPQVFASLAEVDTLRNLLLPAGMPMSLAGPVEVNLSRSGGSNVAVVAAEYLDITAVFAAAASFQRAHTTVVNFINDDPDWDDTLQALAKCGVNVLKPRELETAIESTLAEAEERVELETEKRPPMVLILTGLQRAKKIKPDSGGFYGGYDEEPQATLYEKLHKLLEIGPEVGVHTILGVDKLSSAQRRIGDQDWNEISMRVVGKMSNNDSLYLIDTPEASKLDPKQLILEDQDRALTTRLRSFSPVTADQLQKASGDAT